jgi:hypothetical protein
VLAVVVYSSWRTGLNPSPEGGVVSRSETGWGLVQRLVYAGKDAVQVIVDLVVPKPQYPKALAGKMVIALRVTLRMRIEIVLPTVDFDDEAVFETDEI